MHLFFFSEHFGSQEETLPQQQRHNPQTQHNSSALHFLEGHNFRDLEYNVRGCSPPPLRLEVRDWPHFTQEEGISAWRGPLRRSRGLGPSSGSAPERSPALCPWLRTGPCSPARAPGYSRCTSRSPVKVAEQLVTSAQGTPAAIAAAERVPSRRCFRLGPHHCSGQARGEALRARALGGTALWAAEARAGPHIPLLLLQWSVPAARMRAPRCYGDGCQRLLEALRRRPYLWSQVSSVCLSYGAGPGGQRPHWIHPNPGGKQARPAAAQTAPRTPKSVLPKHRQSFSAP